MTKNTTYMYLTNEMYEELWKARFLFCVQIIEQNRTYISIFVFATCATIYVVQVAALYLRNYNR